MKKLILSVVAVCGLAGCAGRTELFPNSDSMLRKPSTAFAADAAKRFPYKLDAPRAGAAQARAQVGYALDVLEITNLSDEDMANVELWVNQEYCVFLPRMEKHKLKRLPFQMLFDDNGLSFPTDNKITRINKLEMFWDGKMYDVRLQLAD